MRRVALPCAISIPAGSWLAVRAAEPVAPVVTASGLSYAEIEIELLGIVKR